MTIPTFLASRLFSGLAAFAVTGSLLGGTAVAAQNDKTEKHEIREIRHDVRDQTKAERTELEQLRAEFAAEFAKDAPDLDKLATLEDAIAAKRAAISQIRFDALMAMHDSLDADQRARMAERIAGGHGKHERDDKAEDGKGKGKGKAHADGKGKGKSKDKAHAKAEDRDATEREQAKRGKAKGEGKGKDKATI